MTDDLIDSEKPTQQTNNVFKVRAAIIWASLLAAGYLFKVLHWPGSGVLILIPTGGLAAYCLNALLKLKTISSLLIILSIGSALWVIVLFYGTFFNGGHPYNIRGLWLYLTVFVIWFIAYFLILGRSRSSKNKG